jgi:outer membrane protease
MKSLWVLAFSLLVVFGLAAKEHNFSIGGSFGILNGQADELVFRDSTTDDKLSQLLWDFKPLMYAGLDINYSWLKPTNKWGIFVNASFKFGFPSATGVVEDRDWISLYYPNFLTHYSVHDNMTESAILMDFGIGASFVIFQKFLLKAYVSYHYMSFSWAASRGSILYPDWADGTHDYLPLYYGSKKIGTYEQEWHVVSPAIAFYGEFNRFFDIEIAFQATPLIWCNAVDNHLLRDLVITENMSWGLFIEPSLLFSFKPTDHFALSFSFAYRNISGTRGDSVYKYSGPPPDEVSGTYPYIAGAGYTGFDIGLIAKFKL